MTEHSDFPAFLRLPDNTQIESEVGRYGDRIVIGRDIRLSGVKEVLNERYLIRVAKMRRQACSVSGKS